MPNEAFDIEKHHVALGPADGSVGPFGFLLTGAYDKSGQSQGSPTQFGGETDLLSKPSLSRWNQDDFTGGAFQHTWGKDPAMFSSCSNILPSTFDRSLRTVPPLTRWLNFSANGGRIPLAMDVIDNYLYCVFTNGIAQFQISDPVDTNLYGWDFGVPFADATYGDIITWGCIDRSAKRVYNSWWRPSTNAGGIEVRDAPNLTNPPSGEYNSIPNPMPGYAITRFAVANDQIVAQCGGSIWSMPLPSKIGTLTTWTHRGFVDGRWIDSVLYNGALNIVVAGAEGGGQVVIFDVLAQKLLPVADIPYNFRPTSIAVFAGRLYIGGSGTDVQGGERYGELYEVSASSVRLVRTFAPEARMPDVAHRPKPIRGMAVLEGLLFFGDDGRGLNVYDITTDSLYGGPNLQPADGVRQIHKMVAARERIYCWVKHPTDGTQDGIYRIATPNDAAAITAFEGRVITSEFGPNPDRRKRWSDLVVQTRFGSVQAEYSIDGGGNGGDTFVPLTLIDTDIRGQYRYSTFSLQGVPQSHSIRFRFRMQRGKDVNNFTELIAFTASFAFLDTGKWAWKLTVNGAVRVEDAAGQAHEQNVHDIRNELSRYWRDQVPLTFRDTNGETHSVVVSGFTEHQPITAPLIVNDVGEIGREAFYSMTLLEF